ncbi:MAG: signal recognition particle-docking protein FtsY [Candidatus Marinimicrobia bacterium]|nr:signal recognition particle-docking protein FtsY [Candidatus Neomarinimicrobiota bacterium]MBS00685.1 signal recognition particle-docking protein FtsY [Candidatus Neomarinimicrobiota bacterium]MEC7935326.1 signal recognition particle-docking protein FtsY [Candidatus Neomarinimicrobiota bacterium]MEC9106676.1 signal recognition particle-docking protein FtsY [Candidatus Neomarinimicrobiota bacterium]MED5266418.1 signal recognition particle-docking protein FtsY [Candidatus Neomarinimicrobiota b|tara:strand:+ start:24244 stop:25125 length:882 start_codon:yes stop_codon:yes gene_type:complete
MISKLFNALERTRKSIADSFNILQKNRISTGSLDVLEKNLLSADIGVETTLEIINLIKSSSGDDYIQNVKEYMISILDLNKFDSQPLPFVKLIVGVNGTGKTTTAAKIAHHYKLQGNDVVLVAADTYRAAALEQLEIWSKRIDVRLISNQSAKDPSSVIYDGMNASYNKNSNIVIIDTAGRLHTNKNLMLELKKMKRIILEKFSDYSLGTMITIDSTLGQNSLYQAKEFLNYIDIDSATLTKMDGTAKGGIVFALSKKLNIPIEFLGIGENIEDLEEFDNNHYINSLLDLSDG